MKDHKMQNYIRDVLENMPADWLNLTTHRLDIYDEEQAKTEFLEKFNQLYKDDNSDPSALAQLPTAYDYIRLGHPLSSVLEWVIGKWHGLSPNHVVSFSSRTMPILAILRKNLLDHTNTQILYTEELPEFFVAEILQQVYGYRFELKKVDEPSAVPKFNGSTVYISQQEDFWNAELLPDIDFYVNLHRPSERTASSFGSVIIVNGKQNEDYIAEIQHVRRRETIAMTPVDCHAALQLLAVSSSVDDTNQKIENHQKEVTGTIKKITGTNSKPLLASSGLSIQYAIMMGLIDHALENHPGKEIKFIVPPNCYGGTNDQARRVAACLDQVEIVDLPVDGDNDMVRNIDSILDKIAMADAVPYIIAEIPTNPRVQVPDLPALERVLDKKRRTADGKTAIDPVFILDQTFCPNVHFLGEGEILSTMKALSYVSGSKFPSGGLCTAGYCVANEKTKGMMEKIELHLRLCDNEATDHQVEILAKQMPSMNRRIEEAYQNTRKFVDFIHAALPAAKINFVSEELAEQGFTPSVFSLDLPTKGKTEEEKETYKRKLNLELIQLMITRIPDESKFCVSYGQLSGSYWTIPATSTQGTTKEGDKDYIVRVSFSPDMDVDHHKEVFLDFVENIG